MNRSLAAALGALALMGLAQATPAAAQHPERAVRRTLPMTETIRRAHAAGTRDSTGAPGARYWQTRVDYRIEARLDPATSEVAGRETVTIHNASPEAMDFVVLRLDQNLFRANVPRLEQVPEITEGMQVTRIVANGQPLDLTPPTRRDPRAVLGLDQTVARVPLPTPIAAGGTGTLEIDWRFRVTQVPQGRGVRHGAWGDSLVQVAQWYPRVAAYDDLRGWDTEPYLGPSEFYNNFGRFDVRLDVPAGWLVGATGTLQNAEQVLTPEARRRLAGVLATDSLVTVVGAGERGPGRATAGGDRLVWHFAADSVNDFAWAASPVYVWKALKADIPGRGPIPVHVLHTRARARAYEQVPAVTKHALQFYSRLWMPYAFPQHTVVDGPEQGMEYPMLIMSGIGAADHEVGHQWWPMMVGVNETWYGWMDEGFNSYMNILSEAAMEGAAAGLDSLGQRYGRVSGREYEPPLMWNANHGGPMYGFQAYQKAPLMLSMLGGVVGDSAVWRAMGGYAEAWRFKHPSPWDYAFFMDRALGRDLGWFWYYWLFTTESVEGSIRDVRTAGGRTTVTVHQAGEMPSPVVLRVDFAADGPPVRAMPNARMVSPASAVVTWPVDVWFDGARTFEAVLDFGGRRIEWITLDPAGRFPDGNPADNVWPR